jgi:hypothetical protein
MKCPECGGTRLAVTVITWADYVNGEAYAFDEEDLPYVEPCTGPNAEAICRSCEYIWKLDDVRKE